MEIKTKAGRPPKQDRSLVKKKVSVSITDRDKKEICQISGTTVFSHAIEILLKKHKETKKGKR